MSETQHEEGGGAEEVPGADPETAASPTETGASAAANGVTKKKKRRRSPEASSTPPEEAATPHAAADEAPDGADGEGLARLLPEGNPLEYVRGPVAILLGVLLAFVVMAIAGHYRFGVPIAGLGVLVATFGVLDLLGSFGDPDERVARTTRLAELRGPLGIASAGVVSVVVLITLAVAGILPIAVTALTLPAAFMTAVVGVYRIAERIGVIDDAIPLQRRHGFWLIALATLLYLPMLGSHSLTDPWETHYGEVAREILSRDDWISLWWAQDGWFWSKPVFDFWIQALSMAVFGVRYKPNEMLSLAGLGRDPWPEWAVRLPIFLLTLVAVYLLYKAVARVFGRRAGLLGGVVLLTMPQWFLVSHQTMTDMPFVATMAATMALFLLGAHEDPEREVKVYEIDLGFVSLRVSAYHVVIGVIVACALPQVLYLFSRNLDIRLSPFGIHAHADGFMSGSAQNCGLPGNEACRQQLPLLRGLSPALQALIWIQTLGVFLFLNWGERRAQRLCFLAAWFFAALSTMAKGPAGVGLPVLCALAYVVVTKRYRDLLRMEITSGVLILLAVGMPWFVAMYARHGQPFTDRLLFHDMFKRAFTHVHDTNEGDDVSFRFYVWQLGYAMFPWTGLVPASLVWWLRRREDGDRGRGDASVFLALWFLLGFALFSLMLTKFHHYILPIVPAAAMLVGIFLDDALRGRSAGAPREAEITEPHADEPDTGEARALPSSSEAREADAAETPSTEDTDLAPTSWQKPRAASLPLYAALLLGVVGLTVWLTWSGETMGTGPRSVARTVAALAQRGALGAALMTLATATAIAATTLLIRGESRAKVVSLVARFEALQIGAVALGGALLVALVGRDLAWGKDGVASQIRLLHLFTYNYKRPWPPSLDFGPALWFFVVASALLIAAIAVAAVRRQAIAALVTMAVLFTAWGIDVYFVKTSPHWGQRETMIAYYRANAEIPGPIVAYQMNWKGENFYTGNAVPAFVSSGKKFQDYILDEKKKGKKTFYFVTEHGRTGTLQNELGMPKIFDKLTTPELDNKFLLVRATFE